jgi:hypothetical protein
MSLKKYIMSGCPLRTKASICHLERIAIHDDQINMDIWVQKKYQECWLQLLYFLDREPWDEGAKMTSLARLPVSLYDWEEKIQFVLDSR